MYSIKKEFEQFPFDYCRDEVERRINPNEIEVIWPEEFKEFKFQGGGPRFDDLIFTSVKPGDIVKLGYHVKRKSKNHNRKIIFWINSKCGCSSCNLEIVGITENEFKRYFQEIL